MKKGTWVKKNQPTIKICKSFYETKIKMLFFVDFNKVDIIKEDHLYLIKSQLNLFT